jgi:hypothetical protein
MLFLMLGPTCPLDHAGSLPDLLQVVLVDFYVLPNRHSHSGFVLRSDIVTGKREFIPLNEQSGPN